MSSRRSSRPEADSDQAACTQTALDLLARREHSRLELERKLLGRGYAENLVATVLDDLERSGVLAAARFTESFVRQRAARGQGPVRIRQELAERGVGPRQSADLLGAADYDWHALARTTRVKRFGPAPPKDFKERARQARFLQYRGFDSAQINSALEVGDDSD